MARIAIVGAEKNGLEVVSNPYRTLAEVFEIRRPTNFGKAEWRAS